MLHYFPEGRDDLKLIAKANAFTGPVFVGQGLSKRVGSDEYGYYIVSIEKAKNGKPIVGIVDADSKFTTSCTEGSMTCCLPNGKTKPEECAATQWITISGKWKKTGAPKWWYCDRNGKKFNGRHASFGWNGAHEYQNPSF